MRILQAWEAEPASGLQRTVLQAVQALGQRPRQQDDVAVMDLLREMTGVRVEG